MSMYLLGSWQHGGITYYVQAIPGDPRAWNVGVVALGPGARTRSVVLAGDTARRVLDVDWEDPPADRRAEDAEALLTAHGHPVHSA